MRATHPASHATHPGGQAPAGAHHPHTIPLTDGPKGYAIFDKKEDRAIKVMLKT